MLLLVKIKYAVQKTYSDLADSQLSISATHVQLILM